MNILVIAPTPFFADRGCHVRIFEQTKALAGLGHQIVVATYHNGQDIPGVNIHRIPALLFWYRKLEAGPSWWKPLLDVLLLLTCLKLGRSSRFDLILAYLHEGTLIGWICSRLLPTRLPLVFDYQGSFSGEVFDHRFLPRYPAIRWLIHRLEGWIDRSADRIICSSRAGVQDLVERFGADLERLGTVEDTLDPGVFRPAPPDMELKNHLGIPPEATVVGYLGLLNEYQGIELLLQAARLLLRDDQPQVHFLIMGYPNEARYRAMASQLGIGRVVTFTGRIPYLESPRYLNLVDVAVSPKISLAEANGKLYAYMASGLSCVVFDSDVNREIMGDAGVYARLGDTEDLASQMSRLVVDPALRQELGQRACERALRAWGARSRHLVEALQSVTATPVDVARKKRQVGGPIGG